MTTIRANRPLLRHGRRAAVARRADAAARHSPRCPAVPAWEGGAEEVLTKAAVRIKVVLKYFEPRQLGQAWAARRDAGEHGRWPAGAAAAVRNGRPRDLPAPARGRKLSIRTRARSIGSFQDQGMT